MTSPTQLTAEEQAAVALSYDRAETMVGVMLQSHSPQDLMLMYALAFGILSTGSPDPELALDHALRAARAAAGTRLMRQHSASPTATQ